MLEKIREIIAEELGMDISEVTPDADIMEDLDADSLDIMQIVMALEDEFEVKIETETVAGLHTAQEIADCLEQLK